MSGTTGLAFTAGDGINDAQTTFRGTIANINAALNNLTFKSNPNYNGPASLNIITDDLGNVGIRRQ